MKLSILVNEGPYQHEASDTAYLFCKAAMEKGHEISRVFFYHDGVNNANRLTEPPQDDRNIVTRWSKLAADHELDLVVCVAAALRRGIKDEPGTRLSHLRPGPTGRSRHRSRPPRDLRRLRRSAMTVIKKFMFVNRKAPYGTIYALESLEVVLITAAFDQDVSLAFIDDGVYQLKNGMQTKGIETKNFSPTYRALDGYDVEKLYVEHESLEARGLSEEDLLVDVEVLGRAELAELMESQDVVLSF